jgi:hypothetical protein
MGGAPPLELEQDQGGRRKATVWREKVGRTISFEHGSQQVRLSCMHPDCLRISVTLTQADRESRRDNS